MHTKVHDLHIKSEMYHSGVKRVTNVAKIGELVESRTDSLNERKIKESASVNDCEKTLPKHQRQKHSESNELNESCLEDLQKLKSSYKISKSLQSKTEQSKPSGSTFALGNYNKPCRDSAHNPVMWQDGHHVAHGGGAHDREATFFDDHCSERPYICDICGRGFIGPPIFNTTFQ